MAGVVGAGRDGGNGSRVVTSFFRATTFLLARYLPVSAAWPN